MVKSSFRYFKKTFNGSSHHGRTANNRHGHHKHSVYMQSKDSNWLNKNIHDKKQEDDDEPIEEDIRD